MVTNIRFKLYLDDNYGLERESRAHLRDRHFILQLPTSTRVKAQYIPYIEGGIRYTIQACCTCYVQMDAKGEDAPRYGNPLLKILCRYQQPGQLGRPSKTYGCPGYK